jgi:hypothetical protein
VDTPQEGASVQHREKTANGKRKNTVDTVPAILILLERKAKYFFSAVFCWQNMTTLLKL